MAKKKTKTKVSAQQSQELDGVFFLKLMLYVLVGSLWLKGSFGADIRVDLPIGLMIGLAFATHEHFQIDKKIEFAVLIVAMLVGYIAPFGIYLAT
jgi:hypothetical protein